VLILNYENEFFFCLFLLKGQELFLLADWANFEGDRYKFTTLADPNDQKQW
jgi:hypothetical protein